MVKTKRVPTAKIGVAGLMQPAHEVHLQAEPMGNVEIGTVVVVADQYVARL
jgi:hypothetical protein